MQKFIHFTLNTKHFCSWLKNHAPVEKNRKTKIKNREYWSRLVITDLEVLDSGYYQCVVSNSFATVNTTAVLRVRLIISFIYLFIYFFHALPNHNRSQFKFILSVFQFNYPSLLPFISLV